MSSRTFSAAPEGALEVGVAERAERPRPGDRLADAGRLVEVLVAQPDDRLADAVGDLVRDAGQAGADDLGLALAARVVDPVVEAAALERVVELAGAVRGHDHGRAPGRLDRAQLRDRDLEVGEQLEQEGLELVVGAVDLVDQQHDRAGDARAPRAAAGASRNSRRKRSRLGRLAALGRAHREQLARIVPVIERAVHVDPLVALEADQPRAGRRGERLRGLGLADPGLALEQQRLAELDREEDGDGQRLVGEVALARRARRATAAGSAKAGSLKRRGPPPARARAGSGSGPGGACSRGWR